MRRSIRPAIALIAASCCSLTCNDGARSQQPPSRIQPTARQALPRSPITIGKETTVITGPVNKLGYVDYAAAVRQRASRGVTPENNAGVLLLKALGPKNLPEAADERFVAQIGMEPLPAKGDYFEEYLPAVVRDILPPEEVARLREELSVAGSRPWAALECRDVARWLTRNERPLRLAIDASRRPKKYVPGVFVDETKLLCVYVQEETNSVRRLASALAIRAMLHAGTEDIDAAQGDLMAVHRLARLVDQGLSEFDGMSAASIDRIALAAEANLARSGVLSAEQAAGLLRAMRRLPPLIAMSERVDDFGRLQYVDAVGAVAHDPAMLAKLLEFEGYEVPPDQAAMLRREVDWDVALREGNARFTEAAALLREPSYQARRETALRFHEEVSRPWADFGDLSSLPPETRPAARGRLLGELIYKVTGASIGAPMWIDARHLTRKRLAVVSLALAAYRGKEGHYPEELLQLAPKYLEMVPADAYTDLPFRYRRERDNFVLYSVGSNGLDDGGKFDGRLDDIAVGN